jgi:phospholipase/lecithinase/hemolysin
MKRSFTMSFRGSVLSGALVLILVGMMTRSANATAFSEVVAYGDSLSDNGNLFSLAGYPPSPYYNGRFSNGTVAVEQLASALGIPLVDFAVGGATTGVGNYVDGGTQTAPGTFGLPGMAGELSASQPFLTTTNLSSALFVVWGGANDFLVAGSVTTAVSNIDSIVTTLESDGATHILVPGMPDLGLTPDFYGNTTATAYAAAFNALLQGSLPAGATYVDTFNLLRSINSHPGAYGLTDVTDPCFDSTAMTICSNPTQYLFWDGFHPTTTADAILAKEFAAAATPEPTSILLLGSGLSGLAVMLRQRRSR